jgi:regulatory protein
MKKKPATLNQEYALSRSLNWLARREHSRFELRTKLSRVGFTEDIIAAVLSDLAERGWQSEERFCQSMTRHRYQQGYGPRRIEYECQGNQLPPELINTALADPAFDWVAQAVRCRRKKFGIELVDFAAKARQQKYLYDRGFTSEQVQQALSYEDE